MSRRVHLAVALFCISLIATGVSGNNFSSKIVSMSLSTPMIAGLINTRDGGDTAQASFNPSHTLQGEWTLQVLNVAGLLYSQRLCALTLQGIVNKESQNMIYLVWHTYEQQWIDYYHSKFNISAEYYSDLISLIRANKNSIHGYVVYDPAVPACQFIAATICGLNNSVAVSPDMIDMVKNEGINLDMDLRGKFVPGNTTAIYEWGYENLYPLCNHAVIGNMCYNNADDGYYDIYMQIIDYLVSERAFVMGLSSTTEPDHTLKQKFLNGMDKFGRVFGWYGPDDYEWTHVAQASESGQTVVGCFPESPNFSVHSRIDSGVYKQKTEQENPVYSKNKIYITFIFSDGDGLWCANSRWRNNWDSPLRGKMKIGWEVGLALKDVCPDILDYFYESQSPLDEFVGGASGVGYFFPDMMPQDELRQRLTIANDSMHDMDLNCLFTMTHVWPSSETLKQTYVTTMSAKAFFEGYEAKQLPHEVLNHSVWFETNLPRMPVDWVKPWTELKSDIESMAQSEHFIVVHVMPIEDVIEKVYNIAMNFNSSYLVVLPSELASLKMQSVHTSSISDLQDLAIEAGANQTYFIYADPHRMTRSVATYDVSSGNIIYDMCVNPQNQGFDTNPVLVSQSATDRGRLLLHNKTVLMFGGPAPHWSVSFLEEQRLTPVYFLAESKSDGLHYEFIANSTGIAAVDVLASSIDLEHEDYFTVMALVDGNGNHIFISYGFDWEGTWGAGIYLRATYLNIQVYTNSYYIIHWVDTNADGVPQPNEMTQIATG